MKKEHTFSSSHFYSDKGLASKRKYVIRTKAREWCLQKKFIDYQKLNKSSGLYYTCQARLPFWQQCIQLIMK